MAPPMPLMSAHTYPLPVPGHSYHPMLLDSGSSSSSRHGRYSSAPSSSSSRLARNSVCQFLPIGLLSLTSPSRSRLRSEVNSEMNPELMCARSASNSFLTGGRVRAQRLDTSHCPCLQWSFEAWPEGLRREEDEVQPVIEQAPCWTERERRNRVCQLSSCSWTLDMWEWVWGLLSSYLDFCSSDCLQLLERLLVQVCGDPLVLKVSDVRLTVYVLTMFHTCLFIRILSGMLLTMYIGYIQPVSS